MSNAPIGVFDSGVGGLTVLRALMSTLPHEHFVYLGDTARLPYGTKSAETVSRYALQAAKKLLQFRLKCLVVACNTASAAGLSTIRAHAESIPVIGVIEPGAAAACRASASGRIAVVATEATIRGRAYQDAILRTRSDARVSVCAAPLWVALAEEGLTDGSIAEGLVRHYLGSLFAPREGVCDSATTASRPDTLVLGCTHFPMLAPVIRRFVGSHVSIVDSAESTASAVRQQLSAASIVRIEQVGSLHLLATDGAERFARVGSAFLGRELRADQVEIVDLG